MPTPAKDSDKHWLEGTKSQAKSDSGQEFTPGRPKYPRGLVGDAKAAFKRLVNLLESRRALTAADGELIYIFAVNFARHAKALAKLAEEGEIRIYVRLDSHGEPHNVEKENLWLKVAFTAEKNMVACLDRLGLSPMNRAKVKPTARPKTHVPNEFEQFMSGTPSTQWVMPPATDGENDDEERTAI